MQSVGVSISLDEIMETFQRDKENVNFTLDKREVRDDKQ